MTNNIEYLKCSEVCPLKIHQTKVAFKKSRQQRDHYSGLRLCINKESWTLTVL